MDKTKPIEYSEEQLEARKVIQDLLIQTREFLKVVINKSGIRTDVPALSSTISFIMDDGHTRSMFLGDYVPPTETKPAEIRLYIDAIVDYSIYLGIDYNSLIAKVLLSQVHHALTWESKQKFDFIKAEQFAAKACRKLNRQGIVSDIRPKMYMDTANANAIEMTARQKWIDRWLQMELDKNERLRKANFSSMKGKVLPEEQEPGAAAPHDASNTDA
jgi:hypothetical protein